MTRVLHVLQTPRAEGTPNLVLDWLGAGAGRLWQGVLVLNREPADLNDRLRAGASWYREHHLLPRRWAKYPLMSAVTYEAVKETRPDVVVCWTAGFGNWVTVGAKLAGCHRQIVHAGNPPVRGRRGDWVSRYGLWPLAAIRAQVICCSHYVEREYRAIPYISGSNLHAVHNCSRAGAVATRADAVRANAPSRPPTAIMVATLESHKDHATLLDAVPLVLKTVPDFRLKLVGGGSMRQAIESKIRQLNLDSSVELLGVRTDVPELLGASDLFVFSTTPQEGLGSVLIEALAAGLPVIASDVPACRELLEGGRYGELVPPGDPGELAAAIVRRLRGSRQPSDEGREYARGLTAERMMREYFVKVRLGSPL